VEELINKLVEKVGIDRAAAEKVVAFLKEHAAEVPGWLQGEAAQGILSKAKAGLSGLVGRSS
jgi:ABC-type proline/glycine betaine transport system substrate-binding protein